MQSDLQNAKHLLVPLSWKDHQKYPCLQLSMTLGVTRHKWGFVLL